MTEVNFADAQEHFNDWIELLLSGQQDEILMVKDGSAKIKMTLEAETSVKSEARKQIEEFVRLMKIKQPDEVVVTENGYPVIKKESELDSLPQPTNSRRFGVAKGKIHLPPDFDEKFDAMDAEILAMFDDDWGFNTED